MTCPDENEIAVYLDGRLTSDERARLLAHLDECGRCRRLVAETAAAAFAPDEVPTRSPNSRFRRCVISRASALPTFRWPSRGARWRRGGRKPPAIPSMKWQQGRSPASMAASAGSMAMIRTSG